MKFGTTFELLSGHKTQTARIPAQKWYDWYKAVNQSPKRTDAEGPNGEKLPIMLKFCTIVKLGFVKEKRYWQEGFSSPEAFEAIWRKLYNSFDPEMLVCQLEFDVLKAYIVYRRDIFWIILQKPLRNKFMRRESVPINSPIKRILQ